MAEGITAEDEVLYAGLQPLHDYQEELLDETGVQYQVQDKAFVPDDVIGVFMGRFDHILQLIATDSDVAGFTVAEYLPFEEERLHDMFKRISLFTD